MRNEEWINEFAPHSRNTPTTVLHASNLALAPSERDERGRDEPAPRKDSRLLTYPVAAICAAGLVGFFLGRTVIR